MKTDSPAGKIKKERPVKELRYRITVSFIVFAVILMALLWIFQSVFFDTYYELAMRRRCSAASRVIFPAIPCPAREGSRAAGSFLTART